MYSSYKLLLLLFFFRAVSHRGRPKEASWFWGAVCGDVLSWEGWSVSLGKWGTHTPYFRKVRPLLAFTEARYVFKVLKQMAVSFSLFVLINTQKIVPVILNKKSIFLSFIYIAPNYNMSHLRDIKRLLWKYLPKDRRKNSAKREKSNIQQTI